MESPEEHPETLSAEQASEDLDQDRGPGEDDRDGNPADTSETEMTGSAEPGTTATPERHAGGERVMDSHERDPGGPNPEATEGQEGQGGHFDRQGGGDSLAAEDLEPVPTPTEIDEELEDRGDV
jgi:hypothetical protein